MSRLSFSYVSLKRNREKEDGGKRGGDGRDEFVRPKTLDKFFQKIQ